MKTIDFIFCRRAFSNVLKGVTSIAFSVGKPPDPQFPPTSPSCFHVFIECGNAKSFIFGHQSRIMTCRKQLGMLFNLICAFCEISIVVGL